MNSHFCFASVRTCTVKRGCLCRATKEIINCLNIETVLPSMQQITLICPVLSPSRPAFITHWGFSLSRRLQRANIFTKAIKRSSAKAWNYFLIWRHFNEDWRRWFGWWQRLFINEWQGGTNGTKTARLLWSLSLSLSLSLYLCQCVSMSLSCTQHLLLAEVLPRLERKKDIKPLFPLTDRLSRRKPAAFDLFWDTHSRLHSACPLSSKCLRVLSLIGI